MTMRIWVVALCACWFASCVDEKESTGSQPEQGAYSACVDADDCDSEAPSCEGTDSARFCTVQCGRSGGELDPTDCPAAPPDVVTNVGCTARGGAADGVIGFCALMCDDGAACPEGMSCLSETSMLDSGATITTEYCR